MPYCAVDLSGYSRGVSKRFNEVINEVIKESIMETSRFGNWAVVRYPGEDDEVILARFNTFKEAQMAAVKWLRGAHRLDVMKVLPNGTLTTEF